MPALHARNQTVLAAAAIITGGAGAAFAHQIGPNTTEADRPAYLEQKCGHILDATRKVGCIAERSIEFSKALAALKRGETKEHRDAIAKADEGIAKSKAATAEHQKVIADLREEGRCLAAISSAITDRRITRAELRDAYKTPTETTDVCEVARRLGSRVSALTKQ